MRTSLRLVHTVERYAPLIGGAERVVQRVSEGLVAGGHEILVLTTGRRSSEVLNGVRIERFPVYGNSVRGIRGPVDAVMRHVEEFGPDVVFNYAAQTWHTDMFGPLAREPRSYRLVLAPCGFSALHDPHYAAYFARIREWLPHYDALVFHSTRYRDWEFAVAADAPATNMHVIPNAADDPSPRRRADDGETVFITVGSHVRSKGHRDFTRAIRAISTSIPARGVVVAPPRRWLDFTRGCQPTCFLESVRSSRVRFVDGTPAGTVQRELADADAFLFASRVECAPVVILEAMAAGIPWVSYDVGNVRELPGGIVVDDYEGLVAAGLRLARAPDMWAELADAGRRGWQERHRWPDVIEAYERLFLRLARTASGLPRRGRRDRCRS